MTQQTQNTRTLLGTYNVSDMRDALTDAANSGALLKVTPGATGRLQARKDKPGSRIASAPSYTSYRWIKIRVYAGGLEIHPCNRPDDTEGTTSNTLNPIEEYGHMDNVLATVSADDTTGRFDGDRDEFIELYLPMEWLRNPRSQYRGIIDNEYKLGTESVTFYADLDAKKLIVTAPGMEARHHLPAMRRARETAQAAPATA